ncbi:DUF2780 domain-containing protein [Labrys portucalensis]|jgi:hypothetical protein|uniref:DUF2780 domain-containing protein n=1 Tax=Labrys neptuniae TaxID=376174 RepID=A0ABV3PKV7_9HYPH|nr:MULTISPECIES: DUF2780 domain-containing protein [Labrys]MDT3376273.1 DUF2780 domain-containing protein [Labrys neptuniae]MDZ5449945.1 DUF2780 domain-containing protein [Labrys sp. ZIDIC5]OCC04225.1 hypothetical protein BA190_15245 [Labrys sp. WJW]
MEELVAQLGAKIGVSPEVATQAIGAVLAFLEREGPADAVSKLVDSISGAREVTNEAMNAQSGGFMGMLAGMVGHVGGGIAGLGGQLMALGLDLNQIQAIGKELFAYAEKEAGPEVVGKIVAEIPELGQFV